MTLLALAAVSCGRLGVRLGEPAGAGGDRGVTDAAVDAAEPDLDADVPAGGLGPGGSGGGGSNAGRAAFGGSGGALAGRGGAAGVGGGTNAGPAGAGAMACDLTGTWAGKLDVNVSWSGPSLAAGSGQVLLWGKLELVQSGTSLQVSVLPCDVRLPDYAINPAIANETYSLQFPSTLFDHTPAYLPLTMVSTTVSSTTPGSNVNIPQTAVLLGNMLANPLSDSWPAVNAVMSVDNEQDNKPCATVSFRYGAPYALPRLDMAGSARADRAYLAARARFSCTTTLSNCNSAVGTAMVDSLDTHIVGCKIEGSMNDCNTTQRDFIDGVRPSYVVSTAGFRLERVNAGATCATVRATLP